MADKWQRIRFMPVLPLGEDGCRVTGGAAHIALSRQAAADGMVLLKNECALLPFAPGSRIAVFGKAQADYVKGGGGSGDTTVAYVRSLAQGLRIKQDEGKIALFEPLTDFYSSEVARQYASGALPGRTVEPAVPEDLLKQARAFTDTALITLCRFSGEDYDRTGDPYDGDYFLSREEEAMVQTVQRTFSRIAVVLNTGGMTDTLWFYDNPSIGAALLAWQGGIEGGLAAADILVGDVCPSGHLTDTFAASFDAYPSSANFAESDDYVEYQEDIFVGYRYFETQPGAAASVCYPFGYGLSYTTFSLSNTSGELGSDGQILIRTQVTNTGAVSGKHVVQVYCAPARGRLSKPARVLVGFAKTRLLAPGESEAVSIAFTPYDFASYDDEGTVARSSYVLEKGAYTFHIGEHVRSTQPVAFVYDVPEDRVLFTLSPRCTPTQLHRRLLEDGAYRAIPCAPDAPRAPYDASLIPFDGQYPAECPWTIPTSAWTPVERPQLRDVWEGKLSLDAFLDNLSDEEMIHLLGGQPNRGTAITFGFGNLSEYGIPNVMTADGPAGLRIPPECGVCTTAFPCATLLACTWDVDLVRKIGEAGADEVVENGYGVWLTPAINIHRSPLCGRNFEYYSEDPLVAGKMAAAMVQGIQSRGIAASLKHFACNNKETNRKESDSRVSERALREIYLKGFEICVREAQPLTVMSAYNLVNGQRASENRDLLTGILREEWGFEGLVTSDWYTHGEQYAEIAAGNDIKMGRGMPAHTLQMLREGRISREQIKTSVTRLLKVILRLT
ncbi:MAG TPA: glycoside hydrolase family 3 C-terminal domain-containing protein [Candidatus Ventricola gallistercoris]|nr:glycoside hydrolase family 3 C-terminal domain-containing protein [Candidatus Ventricola gallistercoris]